MVDLGVARIVGRIEGPVQVLLREFGFRDHPHHPNPAAGTDREQPHGAE
jgi:hypothetical protein